VIFDLLFKGCTASPALDLGRSRPPVARNANETNFSPSATRWC